MKRKNSIAAVAALIGLFVGVLASSALTAESQTYCDRTEQAIKNQSNLSGAIACFEPGVVDVNLTDRVEQGAELECVCRRSHEGNVEFWAINRANP